MAILTNPFKNDAWSSFVQTSPVDCCRGCLGTPHVKGLIARGYFVAQQPPDFAGHCALSHAVAIVGGDGFLIAADDGNGAVDDIIY